MKFTKKNIISDYEEINSLLRNKGLKLFIITEEDGYSQYNIIDFFGELFLKTDEIQKVIDFLNSIDN